MCLDVPLADIHISCCVCVCVCVCACVCVCSLCRYPCVNAFECLRIVPLPPLAHNSAHTVMKGNHLPSLIQLQVGQFFSRFGEIMDITMVLNMEKALKACAEASKLDHKRINLAHQLELLPPDCHGRLNLMTTVGLT